MSSLATNGVTEQDGRSDRRCLRLSHQIVVSFITLHFLLAGTIRLTLILPYEETERLPSGETVRVVRFTFNGWCHNPGDPAWQYTFLKIAGQIYYFPWGWMELEAKSALKRHP